MPFLSKDWRSPGEKWVRYGGGWEMRKTVWATHRYGTRSLVYKGWLIRDAFQRLLDLLELLVYEV